MRKCIRSKNPPLHHVRRSQTAGSEQDWAPDSIPINWKNEQIARREEIPTYENFTAIGNPPRANSVAPKSLLTRASHAIDGSPSAFASHCGRLPFKEPSAQGTDLCPVARRHGREALDSSHAQLLGTRRQQGGAQRSQLRASLIHRQHNSAGRRCGKLKRLIRVESHGRTPLRLRCAAVRPRPMYQRTGKAQITAKTNG